MEKERIHPGAIDGEGWARNQQLMVSITQAMKEVPQLASEVPQDSNALIKVEFPEGGGVLTYMENYPFPYRGFPFFEFVDKIDLIKKISRQVQSGFFWAFKARPWMGLLLIPAIPLVGRDVFYAFTYSFWRLIDRFKLKVDKYSLPVQEIHRACSVERPGEDERMREIRLMLRDIECMILEYDNAYRFRAQDVLEEFDKEALRKHPVREICRVLDIMIEREQKESEKDEHRKDSWRLLKLVVKWYFRFDRRMLYLIRDILLEIDPEKTRLTKEDKIFCVPRKDYRFGFQANPTREDEIIIQLAQVGKERTEEIRRLREESTRTHEGLDTAQKIEQASVAPPLTEEERRRLEERIKKEDEAIISRYQERGIELQRALNKEREVLFTSFMTKEQKEVAERHLAQREELDRHYETTLQKLRERYRVEEEKLVAQLNVN